MKKCSKQELMEMAGIDEDAKRIHKKTLVDLEINVPVAYESVFMPRAITVFEGLCSETYICKHTNLEGVRSAYEDLLVNYEREVCDLIRTEKPSVVYLLVMRLLAPGFKRSNRFRYVGFMEVNDDCIQIAWIHPFIRNKGIFRDFLVWYGTHENNLAVSPPVFKPFERCMHSASKKIRETPELLSKHCDMCRKFLQKKSPTARVDLLTDEELLRVRQGMEMASAMKHRGGMMEDLGMDEIIRINVETMLFLRENPDAVEELKKFYEDNPEQLEQMDALRTDFARYGNFKKPALTLERD